ncbi:BnaC08g09810D [Brassica napus]|uniref:BnaC08g09810D protein n=1 Tax=Brassica napus TaxID=3708 RepID=A0A078HGH9_BRANA|nr:BnaC08g09810D [Brassica napus]
MACVANTLCFVAALLLIYQKTATCGFLSPIFDNICKAVVCGKGKCKASSNGTFKHECECDNGWKQFDHNLKFLPCVTPNCKISIPISLLTLCVYIYIYIYIYIYDSRCFFIVCHWMNCGEGICKKKNLFLYSCECREGYSNFMNIATSPCFKQCALGQDCLNPGTPSNSSSNASSSSPPALPDGSKSQGPNLRGSSLWLISSMICVSLAPWRLLCI